MNDRRDERTFHEDADELQMLLAGEALGDLDADEQTRLSELRSVANDRQTSSESLRRMAESIELASELTREDRPLIEKEIQVSLKPELIDRIRSDASKYVPSPPAQPVPALQGRSTRSLASSSWIGWVVAASLAIACVSIYGSRTNQQVASTASSVWTQADATAWLNQRPDALQLDWTVKDESLVMASGADSKLGRVVWDTASQSGFMKFTALPINDPIVQQYQLWIIDPKRDDEPVDGGVFDIASPGDAYIPIRAKLNVIEPAGFAITVEKPGGVVVSDQSRLPLLALVQVAQD